MKSAGEINSCIFLFFTIGVLMIMRSINLLFNTFQTLRRMNQKIIPLTGLGACRTELEFLTSKNFQEFASIYSVKELPKKELKSLIVEHNNFKEYFDIPKSVLIDCLFPTSLSRLKIPRKEGYNLLDNTEEILHLRIQNFFAPYVKERNGKKITLSLGKESFSLKFENSEFYFSIRSTFPTYNAYEEANIYGFEDGNFECMICCDANVNTVLMDCCHASTCETCTNSLRDGKCPICRAIFSAKVLLPVKPRPTSCLPRNTPRTSLL